MKLKEIHRTSTFSWSPSDSLPLLATGTVAGVRDQSLSKESQLEIWAPDFLDKDEFDLGREGGHGPKGRVTDTARFNRLAWGHVDSSHPQGVIAAGLENGELALWDPAKILAGVSASESLILRNTTHTGPVRGLDFNPLQTSLLASGGVGGEVYIWDLKDPSKPYSPTPGQRSSKLHEITSVAWNQQVKYVLAGASSTGYTAVWDLRGKCEVVALAYGGGAGSLAGLAGAETGMTVGGRRGTSDIAWHPDNATMVVTASEDDSLPIIMVWDLRNARAPEKILIGHEKGVLSLSWCKQDADLLLSCGKDNRALCWNPQTSEVIGELPSADNWAFQVDWCPRNPDMLATAFFDGTIGIHSIQSTKESSADARKSAPAVLGCSNIDPNTVLSDVPSVLEHVKEVHHAAGVKNVYKSVWSNYSSWSLQYNQKVLKGLSRQHSSRRLPAFERKDIKSHVANTTVFSSAFSHICTIIDFTDEEESKQCAIVFQSKVCDNEEYDPPYPPYLSCTPISQNLLVGDDSHYMPFIPFSDDPTYDYAIDLQMYHYTAWQRPTLGLDEQHIVLETLRRLVNDYKLPYDTIDDTGVLPMHCYDIVKLLRKRDFPDWLPLPLDLPQYTAPDKPSVVIKYFLEYFCSNLNCIMGFCSLHEGNLVAQQVPEYVPPKTPYTKPSDMVDIPCGVNCFLQPPSNLNSIGTIWTEDDYDALATTLRYAPDTTPCDLAIICRKPCREIHRYQFTHPRIISRAPRSRVQYASKSRSYGYDDEKANRFTPKMPCRHTGPCNSQNCDCFKNKGHCHTRCGCAKSCIRRWKGCSCARSEKICGTKKCSCYRAHFECDPEVCLPCGAKDDTNNLCKNVGIQKGTFKVKESQWGLGLFLAETAEENELISEYVGECIRPETVDSRSFHADHRQRSYVFHLNPVYALDSGYAGNGTRYMNHSAEAPNCHTKVVLVNGEHRIGVYAARHIEKDEELLINYGSNFWKSETLEDLEAPELSVPPPTYNDPKDLTYMDVDSH